MVSFLNYADAMKKINSSEYELFQYMKDGVIYRVESTPVSVTAAGMKGEGGWFSYHLPKIPAYIMLGIYRFFARIAHSSNTEVLVRLYYDYEKKKYILEVPEQHVTPSSVSTDTILLQGVWPVADFHSHGSYEAFFSSVDNQDELGNRIYGVIGSLHAKRPSFCLRAGTGGCFVNILANDIFDLDNHNESNVECIFNYLMEHSEYVHV